VIDILIHKEVPSMNVRERMHWRAQRREVSTWEAMLRAASTPSLWQRMVGTRAVVHIHAFRRQRTRDEANLIGGCKGLIDGLVRAGLLVDDSREWATFTYVEDVASKSPTRKPCTRILIEDVTP
jgi:hypothetical protein